MASTKLLLALCFCAAAVAVVCGQTQPSTFGFKHGGGHSGGGGGRRGPLVLSAKTTYRTPDSDAQEPGTTAVGIKELSCGDTPVGTLKQTGIYVSGEGEADINFQVTVTLDDGCGRYGPGKIFLVGDGTGLYAARTLDKAIVGGTGQYVGKLGKMIKNESTGNLEFWFTN